MWVCAGAGSRKGPLLSREKRGRLTRCDALDTTAGRNMRERTGSGGVGGSVARRTGHRSIGERRQSRVQATCQGPGNSRIPSRTPGYFQGEGGQARQVPKVTKIRFEILAQDNGKACPAPGETVKVNRKFTLRKAIKFSKGNLFGSPWMLTAKDALPSNDHPEPRLYKTR